MGRIETLNGAGSQQVPLKKISTGVLAFNPKNVVKILSNTCKALVTNNTAWFAACSVLSKTCQNRSSTSQHKASNMVEVLYWMYYPLTI